MNETSVAIVEDNPGYRESLQTLLGHTEGFTVRDVFGNAERLLDTIRRKVAGGDPPTWQLVLMDIELPGKSGIEATRELTKLVPDVSVVMLTVFEDPRVILEAICAGASGYVLKKATAKQLVSQLRSVVEGGAPLSPAVALSVINIVRTLNETSEAATTSSVSPTRLDLTDREQDVLRCLVRGLSYIDTASELAISDGTVRTHVRSVYKKLRVHSVAQAVRKAMERGLV